MKKLLLILLTCLPAFAASRITATLTITNIPVGLNTFTAAAKTITWTNSTAGSPSTTVLIGASIGASATNLFRQLSSYQLTGPVDLGFSSSNVITIKGAIDQALTASISAAYGTVAMSTQTVTELKVVRVPMSGEPTASNATNIASLVVTNIGILSTNPIRMLYGIRLPIPSLGVTNAILFETGFAAIAPNGNGYPSLFSAVTGGPWESADDEEILNVYSAKLIFPQSAAVVTNNWYSTNFFGYITATGGHLQQTTLQNGGLTNVTGTNTTLTSTTTVTGSAALTRANHTSLANGNNSGVDFGTKVFAKIKAGPTAAFAICGIAGGADGRILTVYNATGQDMTIPNDSGLEATAANRIYTNTGGTLTITANGFVQLIYDSEDSRWVVMNYQP